MLKLKEDPIPKQVGTFVVEEYLGGGASVVEARRRSVLAARTSRKSLAENAGVSGWTRWSPRSPEMIDQRLLGSLALRETDCKRLPCNGRDDGLSKLDGRQRLMPCCL